MTTFPEDTSIFINAKKPFSAPRKLRGSGMLSGLAVTEGINSININNFKKLMKGRRGGGVITTINFFWGVGLRPTVLIIILKIKEFYWGGAIYFLWSDISWEGVSTLP